MLKDKNKESFRKIVNKCIRTVIEEDIRKEEKLRLIIRKLVENKMEQRQQAVGEIPLAIRNLDDFLVANVKSEKGNYFAAYIQKLNRPEYRRSFLKHVIQLLIDELSTIVELTNITKEYGKQTGSFLEKVRTQLTEDIGKVSKVSVDLTPDNDDDKNKPSEIDEDGLPATGLEVDEEEEKDPFATSGKVLGTDSEGEIPEDYLPGESKIGRTHAEEYIKQILSNVVEELKKLDESPEDKAYRLETSPDSIAPQELFLQQLLIHIVLHAWKLENQFYNTAFDDMEKIYGNVLDKAESEREGLQKSLESSLESEAFGGEEGEEKDEILELEDDVEEEGAEEVAEEDEEGEPLEPEDLNLGDES